MAKTTFALQDPLSNGSKYLLEVLLEHSIGGVRGGAAYAWATVRGINLLFEDDVFIEFLKTGSFELVIGVDEITTPEALQRLAQAESDFPGLNVRAFLSDDSEGLFHPKYAWFAYDKSGSLIVGSGNLTGGGLWDNREAFTITEYGKDEVAVVEAQWGSWRTANSPRLYKVTDKAILERAASNRLVGRRGKRAVVPPAAPATVATDDRLVLIAEVAKGGRWAQANFHKTHYENFFGAQVGTQKRVRMRSVDVLGQLGEDESRPSVQVASQNYRFEIGAARGVDYPENGRAILVFLRIRPRTFVYALCLSGTQDYAEVVGYLDSQEDLRPDRMRQVVRKASELPSLEVLSRLSKVADDAFEDEVPG